MNKNELWNLRCQIVLDALYICEYNNTFDIPECKVQRFFDGYYMYLQQFMQTIFDMDKYDNINNLWDYYCSLNFNPFQNVSRETKE